jgi:hypothetical protein
MVSGVVVAGLLVWFAATSPGAHAQYFRPGPFAYPHNVLSGQPRGGLPNSLRAPADRSTRGEADPAGSDAITYRTLCVRLCDGYYFPISFAIRGSALARDADQCAASCGVEGRLFYHANPGGSVAMMTDLSGRAYTLLPTAFQYRAALVAGCSCQPQPLATAPAQGHIPDPIQDRMHARPPDLTPDLKQDRAAGPVAADRAIGRRRAPKGIGEATDHVGSHGGEPQGRLPKRPPAGLRGL